MVQKRKRKENATSSTKRSKKQTKQPDGNTPSADTVQSRLMSLPPELRITIYEFVLLSDGETDIIPDLEQPPLLRACRQIRREALNIWYLNTFAIDIIDCDASLLIKFDGHLQATKIELDIITIAMSFSGRNWSNLMVWCKAVWACKCRGMAAGRREDLNGNEAVIRAAHKIGLKHQSWAECEEELADLRFLVSRFEKAWLQ